MKTRHLILPADSRDMSGIGDESIDFVVTSPPYPMIEMWDELFSSLSPTGADALKNGDGNAAFEAMHVELDRVWRELGRVLKPRGSCLRQYRGRNEDYRRQVSAVSESLQNNQRVPLPRF